MPSGAGGGRQGQSIKPSISRDEAMSNGEKIKPIALAVIELRLSEGIRQAVSQSVVK